MAQRYSDETKGAVMAALLAGQSVSSIAKEYRIPRGTVAHWRSLTKSPLSEADRNTKRDIGDLLLEYLQESLVTLTEQVKHFRDRDWLANQDASDLAVLHGVQTDKAIRLLEALSDSATGEEPAV